MTQNTNLLVCPNDWGDYKSNGTVNFDGGVQITHLDTAVTHNGDLSVRVDPHQGTRTTGTDVNFYRECDGVGIPVKVGDHVLMKVWIKTGHSTLGKDGFIPNGGLIGFDYYAGSRRLREHSSDKQSDTDPAWSTYLDDPNVFVPFNSDWTLRVIDTIVPSQCLNETTGQIETNTITALIPWFMGGEWIVQLPDGTYTQDEGLVWFASTELYVNPNSTPTPVVLTINANSNGSTWPTSGTWPEPIGTVVSISANPASNYYLSGWIVDGVAQGPSNPLQVTMNANHSVQPVFSADIVIFPSFYNLTINSAAGGTTSPTGTITLNAGSNQAVTAIPESGYAFQKWIFDGVDQTPYFPTATFTLSNIQANHTLTAVFAVLTPPATQGYVTVNAIANALASTCAVYVDTSAGVHAATGFTPCTLTVNTGDYVVWCDYEGGANAGGQSKSANVTVTANANTPVTFAFTTTPAPSTGCFIATAAYGSPTHYRVNQLRAVKNDLCPRSRVARVLYHAYYVFSPSVAKKIVYMEKTKRAIRAAIEFLWSVGHGHRKSAD